MKIGGRKSITTSGFNQKQKGPPMIKTAHLKIATAVATLAMAQEHAGEVSFAENDKAREDRERADAANEQRRVDLITKRQKYAKAHTGNKQLEKARRRAGLTND